MSSPTSPRQSGALRHVVLVLALLLSAAALLRPVASRAEGLPGLAQAARRILGANQGVFVQAQDGRVLLAQAAARAVHPASVSKVPTTIALLRRLGPEWRFTTRFETTSPLHAGTLQGNLIVAADGDPSLVDEDALLVAARLRAAGIERIEGQLQVRGPLTFDWQPDPTGQRLALALAGHTPAAAWQSVQALLAAPGVPGVSAAQPLSVWPVGLSFAQHTTPSDDPAAPRTLLVYRSAPLLPLLKSLNDYSNNIFKPLADAAGGAPAVQALARSLLPADMADEVVLGDGAGTDPRNRLSPRAAVYLLEVLDHQLQREGHTLCDVLPVAGIDEGTLRARLNAPGEAGHVVGKTGTYGSYGASALIGAIPTSDLGTVYFAILDHGVPVPEARRRQDRFVRALLAHLHSQPWPYQRDGRPAVARAEVAISRS